MLGSDAQKYFILREKKGLIWDGYMLWTRNPNYLGEMMLYSAFACIINSRNYWIILLTKWFIVFSLRMIKKEYSLS